MENFDRLTEKILSFHINEVEYDGSIYKVIRDNITNHFYTPAMGETIRKAILELLSDKTKFAIKKVTYLKSLIGELTDFNLGAQNNHKVYWRFREICANGNFKMEIPCEFYPGGLDYSKLKRDDKNSINVIKDELARMVEWENYQAKIIYSQNFIDDIIDAIDNRMAIINDLEKALQRAVNGIKAKSGDLTEVIPKRFKRAIDNELMPNELTLSEWETICKMEDIYISEEGDDTNNKGHNVGYSFENDILNEKGRAILGGLIKQYSGVRAQKIGLMLLALEKSELCIKLATISPEEKIANSLSFTFKNQYSREALRPTLNKNAKKVTDKTIEKEMEIIKTMIGKSS